VALEQAERRLAAIMFTDIVGYTALMAESEERGLRARERHRTVLGPLAEQYGGRIVDENGDELVLSFASAVDAVNCALAGQSALRDDAELRLRIGIHLGDVVFEHGRIYGDGVNVAARIRPLADPGGVCVSDEVQHAVQNQENIATRSLGARELKNVPRPVEVFTVSGKAQPPRLASVAAPEPRRRSFLLAAWVAAVVVVMAIGAGWWLYPWPQTLSPIRSIAVLPLENLSGDPAQEYVADGMTGALIAELAKLDSLRVISRTSVMQYKGTRKPLQEIAQQLGVHGIIEGTVIREGDQVRVTAQLIDARNDTHLWADRFDHDLPRVLALQSDVARAVAEQIRLELTPAEHVALTTSRTVDPGAHDAYLRGQYLLGSYVGPEGLARAIDSFERAIELQPDYAAAYVGLSRAHANSSHDEGGMVSHHRAMARARAAALGALEHDDSLGGAHAALGNVLAWYDWNWAEAGNQFRRALEFSPGDAFVLDSYAAFLSATGRHPEAISIAERAVSAGPLDLYTRYTLANALLHARHYERALEESNGIATLNPDSSLGYGYSAWVSLQQLGRQDEMFETLLKVHELALGPMPEARRAYAEGGIEGCFRVLVALHEASVQDGQGEPFALAVLHASLGQTDQAFAWLERAVRERSRWVATLAVHPVLDPLRSDPRFQDLLRRIGFPES
jgi:TolB-like protein/class 3 adenylate cyclase